jgi:hypothetical protein
MKIAGWNGRKACVSSGQPKFEATYGKSVLVMDCTPSLRRALFSDNDAVQDGHHLPKRQQSEQPPFARTWAIAAWNPSIGM